MVFSRILKKRNLLQFALVGGDMGNLYDVVKNVFITHDCRTAAAIFKQIPDAGAVCSQGIGFSGLY